MYNKPKLSYCSRCKENSVVRKVYITREATKKRVKYCINKGCKYTLTY
jgi:hypothetical protein